MSKNYTIQELFEEALSTDTDLNHMDGKDIEKSAIEYKDMVKALFFDLVGNPIGEDGIPHYNEPTTSVLLDIRRKIEEL